MTISDIPNINPQEFALKGEKVYKKIKQDLEKSYKDKYVAIEPDSKEYFIADESMEAINKAKKKFPKRIFYLVKIGNIAVRSMSSHFKPINYGSIF